MFTYFQKKIVGFIDRFIKFFIENLPQVIFLVFFLQFALIAKSLPYLNLITNYEFYVITTFLVLVLIIFRVVIPYDKTVKIVLVLLWIAAIFEILEQVIISTLIGFIVFIFLFLIVSRQIIAERGSLEKIKQ